jgi:aryl-alcohol dehydrogenase (NADP+)
LLTGKYLHDNPPKARLNAFTGFGDRYRKPNVTNAVAAYVEIAKAHNIKPSALALAFARSRWFVASTIIGATSLDQLKENLDSVNVELDPTIFAEIDAVNALYPNPAQ